MITLIASVTNNGGIGYKGNLIYRSKEDMRFFKEVTYGNTVIMGRKTFESIGTCFTDEQLNTLKIKGKNPYTYIRPLKDRDNIILTKDIDTYLYKNIYMKHRKYGSIHHSVESVIRELLGYCSRYNDDYAIGGASIYEQFLPFADKMILTRVDTVVEADTFFPEVDYSEWELKEQKDLNSNSVVYTYFRK